MRARTRNTPTRALLPLLAAALLASCWPAPAARAAAYTYGTQQRTVNAGILLVDDANSGDIDPVGGPQSSPGPGASNPDPYIFYIFNQRSDLKPFGWNVVNPLAPPTVTGAILNRWNYRPANGNASSGYYQLGEAITPDMAPYWEVSLSKTTLTNLLQYDVLLLDLGPLRTVRFTDAEVHNLRRYVDAGGQLLVESSGGNINSTDSLFFNGNFNGGGGTPFLIPATSSVLLRHPIIASPYLLSQQELNGLGTLTQTVTTRALTTPIDPLLSTVLASTAGGHPTALAAAQYGAGQIVMDATGSLAVLNDSVPGVSSGYGTALGYNGASNSGPRCEGPFTAAPAANLKLLADILSWTGAHPNEHKNSHQSTQSPAVVGPALSPTWLFPSPGNAVPPGAAINGSFVYVRGADGVLRAFNASPGTDILGTGDTDAGYPDYDTGLPYDEVWSTLPHRFSPTATPPATLADPLASAPTVASFGGTTYVFVERASGAVSIYNATDGTSPTAIPAAVGPGTSVSYTTNTTGPAPAPTFYDGRLYAGQADGSLYVYDFNPGRSASNGVDIQIDTAGPSPSAVIAPPTVGVVRQTLTGLPTGTDNYSDDVIAALTTATGVFTVQLGSRHDPLISSGVNTYRIHAANQGAFGIDANAPFNSYYFQAGSGYQSPAGGVPTTGNPAPSTTKNAFGGITAGATAYYGDYDVDFADAQTQAGTPAYVLTRSQFGVGPSTGPGPPASPATAASAAVLSATGSLYYTLTASLGSNINSTLVSAHDTRTNGAPAAQMQWRFRLPFTSEVNSGAAPKLFDADGVAYDNLGGFQFVGAPVVDRNDNVFALAYRPSSQGGSTPVPVAILCFSGDQRVTAQIAPAGTQNAQVTSITQPVAGTGNDEFNNTATFITGGAQYTQNVNGNTGQITLLSFGGLSATTASPTIQPVLPNLSEPQPISVTYSINGSGTGTPTPALLHTNLVWYAILPSTPVTVNGLTYPAVPNLTTYPPTTGLTLVGNYLYYGDANGDLVRVYAYPQNAGLVTNRYAALTPGYATGGPAPTTSATVNKDGDGRAVLALTPTGAGQIGGVPSAGSGALVVNGLNGVAAFGGQNTLVADAGRVLELDADGIATWAVDATTRLGANNVATHLDLNHPSAVTQLTANDYLVADTGNSRCVRFDRAGNVLWELTRFTDMPLAIPSHTDPLSGATVPALNKTTLLAPGEPTTLSRPSSVDTYTDTNVPDSTHGGNYTIQHYLISDTGNSRVLDIVDVYDGAGNLQVFHDLFWVSHTYDAQRRSYSYTGANYYHSYATGKIYVAALVSNTRIAQLSGGLATGLLANALGQLGAPTADAPGASVVLLDYDPFLMNTGAPNFQRNGYIGVSNVPVGGVPENQLSSFSSFSATLTPRSQTTTGSTGGNFDLNGLLTGTAPSSETTTLYLRNPRFLKTYTNKAGGSATHFLLADDNGVFDLIPNQVQNTNAGAPPLAAVWGFTQADYSAVQTPIDATTLAAAAAGTSTGFDRTNVPFLPTSLSRIGGVSETVTTPSQIVGRYLVSNGFSQGEVTPTSGFGGEVLDLSIPAAGTTLQTQEAHGSVAPFTGTTLGKPSNTSPVSQPAYAAREK